MCKPICYRDRSNLWGAGRARGCRESLLGMKGDQGMPGDDGVDGPDGENGYCDVMSGACEGESGDPGPPGDAGKTKI